ncbi:MAG: multicopper oxidase domain-containing protein [Dehalococcoidia bacterium]|nr:multicopper oxidase domain-containing protein [Dehalococcoidia bacterium]
MRSRLLALLSLVPIALGTLACSAPPAEHAGGDLAATAPAAVLEVELRDLAFVPPTLQVTSNQIVELRIQNAGTLDHDFTIERIPADALVLGAQPAEHDGHGAKYPVHAAPPPGDTVTVRLHPHEAGTYTYYCTVNGHREAGMSGTIVVG